MSDQRVTTLMEPIRADSAAAPMVVRVVTPSVDRTTEMADGVMSNPDKVHTYVLFDALPREMQEKIKMYIEAMSW